LAKLYKATVQTKCKTYIQQIITNTAKSSKKSKVKAHGVDLKERTPIILKLRSESCVTLIDTSDTDCRNVDSVSEMLEILENFPIHSDRNIIMPELFGNVPFNVSNPASEKLKFRVRLYPQTFSKHAPSQIKAPYDSEPSQSVTLNACSDLGKKSSLESIKKLAPNCQLPKKPISQPHALKRLSIPSVSMEALKLPPKLHQKVVEKPMSISDLKLIYKMDENVDWADA
jgi:hypothetical protein